MWILLYTVTTRVLFSRSVGSQQDTMMAILMMFAAFVLVVAEARAGIKCLWMKESREVLLAVSVLG